MNEWLVFWLALTSLGPLAFLAAWAFQSKIDDGYEALGIFMIVITLCLASIIGFLGLIGWLSAWGFG